jgi:hypothetical protein
MRRSWLAAGAGAVATLVLAGNIAVGTALADDGGKDPPQDRQRNKPKDVPSAWTDPVVSGIATRVMWVEGKSADTQTAAMGIWSTDADLEVIVYGDDPAVRQALIDGVACAGRYVVVGGDRLDEHTMIGRSIEVPNLDMACTQTLQ